MKIELDKPGEPHWLSKPGLWLRALAFELRQRREARAFLKKHGPVVKVEDMPRRPRRKK